MKKVFKLLLVLVFVVGTLPFWAAEEAPSECDYEANRAYQNCAPLGYGAEAATHSTISMSMIGWGLGLALAIAVLAGIIHQSATAHHSDSSSS